MKSLLVTLGVILIGLAIFGYAEVKGEDWKPLGVHDICLAYYDTQSITRPSKNIVGVWTREDFTEKGVIAQVEKFGKKYENLNHSKTFWEINCSEKKFCFQSLTNYNNNGEVIDSSSSPSKWFFIIPESIGEKLYKEVCQ
jgi:hypothetical protein